MVYTPLGDQSMTWEITEGEFRAVVESFANTDMLEKIDGRWRLKPAMVKGLEKGGEFSFQDRERYMRRSLSESEKFDEI